MGGSHRIPSQTEKTVAFSVKEVGYPSREACSEDSGPEKEAEPGRTLVLSGGKRGKHKSSVPGHSPPYHAIWRSPYCLHAPVMDIM